MSSGPIEYLSDRPAHKVGATEFGGSDGLIQPAPHEMTASEASAALTRAGMVNVDNKKAVIDPFTGRVVPTDLNGAAPTL